MAHSGFKLPDTGQILSYDREGKNIQPEFDDDYYGQDGCFSIHPMSFTKLDDTGRQIEDGSFWPEGYRAVKDNHTGLIWEVKSPVETDTNFCGNTYSWKEANEEYIQQLNSQNYAGRNDWRIPNRDEIKSIISYDRVNPALDSWYFPYSCNGLCWTSFTYEMQPYFAYVVSMGLGSATAVSKNSNLIVRGVAGGKSPLFGKPDSSRFVDHGDGTISDLVVGLMWQQGENPRMSWYEALQTVKTMKLGGYDDWRLPNIKELNTILDLSYQDSWWYFKELFPAEGLQPPLLHYYSSTSFQNTYAWVTNFCFGYDGYYANKNSPLLFRAVRNIHPLEQEKKPYFSLPSTGIGKLYDDEGNILKDLKKNDRFFGQDGSYGTAPLSYTKLRAQGHPVDDQITWEKGFRMLKDNHTGLIWEVKSPSSTDSNYFQHRYSWAEAHGYIEALNREQYGGFDDWRLPGKEELRSIVDYSKKEVAISREYFPYTLPEFYWSSDVYGADPQLIWGIYFAYGCGIAYLKDIQYPVRAVRAGYQRNFGNQKKPAFVDQGDGTISDVNTYLMWKKEESPPLNWVHALAYCEDLDLGGYTDWRLPNQKELATILDLSYKNQSWFHEEYFPETKTKPTGFYLSSSTFMDTFAWGVNFQFAYDGYYGDKKHGEYFFRPVRTLSR